MSKTKSYRQLFGYFRKSTIGKDVKHSLYRSQLGICPSCMKPYTMDELEIHHLKPLSVCEKEGDIKNLTHIENLVLLCRSCNASQGAKLDTRFD